MTHGFSFFIPISLTELQTVHVPTHQRDTGAFGLQGKKEKKRSNSVQLSRETRNPFEKQNDVQSERDNYEPGIFRGSSFAAAVFVGLVLHRIPFK